MGDIGDLTARYGHPGSNSDVHFVGLVTDDGPLAPPDGTTVTYTELVISSVAEPSTNVWTPAYTAVAGPSRIDFEPGNPPLPSLIPTVPPLHAVADNPAIPPLIPTYPPHYAVPAPPVPAPANPPICKPVCPPMSRKKKRFTNPETRRQNKKEQNKEAAVRYRRKQKDMLEKTKSQETREHERNCQLNKQLNDLNSIVEFYRHHQANSRACFRMNTII